MARFDLSYRWLKHPTRVAVLRLRCVSVCDSLPVIN